MKPLRTLVPVTPLPFHIQYKDLIFTIGSCFSEHISMKLSRMKFQVLNNPFGILYNPASILRCVERIAERNYVDENALFYRDELYGHWDFHGSHSNTSPHDCATNMNSAIEQARHFLKNCRHIFITPGTAYAYVLKSSGEVVGNCHKFPPDHFVRKLLSVTDILESFRKLIDIFRFLSEDAQIVFTVSPVRHIRDGLVANQRSKAHLHTAIHQLAGEADFVHYYPSYELIQDDLRDYRFYARDMCHIDSEGVDYVWEHFQQSFFNSPTLNILGEVEAIQKSLEHKPHHPGRKAVRRFYEDLLSKIESLEKNYPEISFDKDRQEILSRY